MTTPAALRGRLVDLLRRDLIGPGPDDADIATELLPERPGRWYLTGYLVPAPDSEASEDEEAEQDLPDIAETPDPVPGGGKPEDEGDTDQGPARHRYQPSSIGLTVQVPLAACSLDVTVTWGDYTTEPPMTELELTDRSSRTPLPNWRRHARRSSLSLPIPLQGRSPAPVIVPDSAAPGRPGGALVVEAVARPYKVKQPDGSTVEMRVVTVLLVNRRAHLSNRAADLTTSFQVRLELACAERLLPRADLSAVDDTDFDRRLADLHYRDVVEYAVGHTISADWDKVAPVRRAWTDPLPVSEVERVAPNTGMTGVVWGMEELATASADAATLHAALAKLPDAYGAWIAAQASLVPGISRPTAAGGRAGADRSHVHRPGPHCRGHRPAAGGEAGATGFRADERGGRACSTAPQRRTAGRPCRAARPGLAAVPARLHPAEPARAAGPGARRPRGRWTCCSSRPAAARRRPIWASLPSTIAHRRLIRIGGLLGAGVTVLMRYTLRLLTLDQLSRAAGVVCALELMRGEPAWQEDGKRLLGDWPIEIGLWVGSAATPNRLGGKRRRRPDTAVARVQRIPQGRAAKRRRRSRPAPGAAPRSSRDSFACTPNDLAPKNMEIRCADTACDFTGDRALPVLTVDEAIYRRLPAFLIATVDKFAGLPWLGEAGAFFGHVDRED